MAVQIGVDCGVRTHPCIVGSRPSSGVAVVIGKRYNAQLTGLAPSSCVSTCGAMPTR
jgi:hypothetical protein